MESNTIKFNNSMNKNYKISNSRNNSTNSIIYPIQRNNEKLRSKSENEINLNSIEDETNKYIEEMKKGTYNILVAIRCRPLNQKEKEYSTYNTLNIINKKLIILKDPNGIHNINNNRSKEITMAFDYAFDEYESQESIFNSTTKFLIDGVVNGFNATVFAYGATGAGKTYTMLGNEKEPGIMPLTLKELFNKINTYPNREYTIKLWYLEIYNEYIRDLLSNNNENNNLDLREDQNKGIVVSGITEITATSSEHILTILKKGNKNRTTESTNANVTSSRSHAILQIMVSYKEKNSGIEYEIKYGKLSLIDLAGSERASVTLNRGTRLIEGANINRSLLTLGNCINALCEANEKGTKPYIPYRDSKLTRLLKDSLGGNARTVMIANVSPSLICFDDTYNTLNYANRAKKIKTNIKRNVFNAKYHISNYTNIIKNLQNRILDLENQISHQRDMTLSPSARKNDDGENKKLIDKIKLICENQIKVQKKIVGNNYEIFKLKKKVWDEDVKDNDIKDKIQKVNEIVEKYSNNLKEINKTIDSYSNKISKLNELEKDYTLILISNSKNKVNNINLAYKIILMKDRIDKLNDYIKELEKQIIVRDDILSKKNVIIENLEKEIKENYKTLINIKEKFNLKKPEREVNNSINDFFKDTSPDNSRLPPLSNNSVKSLNKSEVDTVLSNIRDVNNSINNINIKLKNFDNNNKTLIRPKSSINMIQNKSYIKDSPKKNKTKFFPITNQFKVIPGNYNINRKSYIPRNLIVNIPESAKPIPGKMRNNINVKYRIKNRSVLTEQNSDTSHHSFNLEAENIRANQIIINGSKIENGSKRYHSNHNVSLNSSGENTSKDKSYPKLINMNIFRNGSNKSKSPIKKIQINQKKKIPFKI